MRVVIWSAVGFGVGVFWFLLALVFFTVSGPFATIVFGYIARITCPPLLSGDYFTAPFWNAVLYGGLAYATGLTRSRNRRRPN